MKFLSSEKEFPKFSSLLIYCILHCLVGAILTYYWVDDEMSVDRPIMSFISFIYGQFKFFIIFSHQITSFYFLLQLLAVARKNGLVSCLFRLLV